MIDQRAVMAAANNADWYGAMFDVHGLRGRRSAVAFCAVDDPPPYFSSMTILEPVPSEHLLQLIAAEAIRPGFGVKDSFQALDLASFGLVELFAATWIWRPGRPEAETPGWYRVDSAEELEAWEDAWKVGGSPSDRRQFPDRILGRPDVAIWGRRSGDGFDAGVIASRSSDCVGISNFFGADVMPAAATLCAELAPERPIVGYARGDALVEANDAGFEPVGSLRVAGR